MRIYPLLEFAHEVALSGKMCFELLQVTKKIRPYEFFLISSLPGSKLPKELKG